MKKILASSLLPFLIIGCSVIPKIEKEEIVQISDINMENSKIGTDTFSNSDWWLNNNTSQNLKQIIELTLSSNTDLKSAQYNIQKSLEAITLAKSQGGFNVNMNGSAVRQKIAEHGTTPPPFNGQIINLGTLDLQATYDIDLFNRVGALAEEAQYKSEATALNAKWARFNISVETAKLYYYWNYLQEENKNLVEQKNAIEKLVELEKAKYEIGLGVEEDYLNAQNNLRDIESLIKTNVLNQNVTFNSLNSLSGNEHTQELKTLLSSNDENDFYTLIPSTVSSDIVINRYDVASYLMLVRGQEKHLESAKAGFYPHFSITGQYGFESLDFNKVLQRSSLAGVLGGSVYLPIFNMGAVRSNYKVAGIDLNILIEEYNQAILDAYTSVNNELLKTKTMENILEEKDKNLATQEKIWKNSNMKFEIGDLSNYEYLVDEVTWLQAKLDNKQNHFNFTTQQLNFISSIGGAYVVGGNNGTIK